AMATPGILWSFVPGQTRWLAAIVSTKVRKCAAIRWLAVEKSMSATLLPAGIWALKGKSQTATSARRNFCRSRSVPAGFGSPAPVHRRSGRTASPFLLRDGHIHFALRALTDRAHGRHRA